MDNVENSIEQLILSGALEPAGIDLDTGEPLYNFTEKLQDVYPELHAEAYTYFTREAMNLWELGFIEMDITSENPMVSLTSKAFDASEMLKLEKNQQFTLKEMIRYMAKDE